MVVGQILSNKRLLELAGKPEEKDRYLMASLGISERKLRYLRTIFNASAEIRILGIPVFETQNSVEINRLYRAGEVLGRLDPKFITEMNLAALIFTDWDEPIAKAKKIHHQLKKLYRQERDDFFAKFEIKLAYIEFLRQEVTKRELNCLKARETYKKFEVSREDIQRNISLPDLNYESCVLLAGYWGKVSLNLKGRYVVLLEGSEDSFNFYKNWVKEKIMRLHNLEVEVESFPIKGYSAKTSRITICSRAITTWLRYDLGFPRPKENVNLPKIEWNEERKQGFFDGIIAFMGGSLGKRRDIALHDSDLDFIKNLNQLAKELGYTPNIVKERFEEKSKSYRLYFSPTEVKRMNLINPKHCLKINKGG